MRQPPAPAIAFLEQIGANERRHVADRTLYDHLISTYGLLAGWQAPEEITLAGLFHSVYGTQAFDHPSLPPDQQSRQRVRQIIGETAERLSYLFCAMDRQAFFNDPKTSILIDRFDGSALALLPEDSMALCEILFANEIDLAIAKKGGDPAKILAKMKTLADHLLPHLPDRAAEAWRRLVAPAATPRTVR
jgi:hypothetical protein